jgi:F0F1-type ATP synthase assembly protein I
MKDWMSAVRDSSSYLGIGSSLAFTMLLSLGAGYWIDRRFRTEPAFFLVGAGFGLFAVFYNLYKVYKLLSKKQ